MHTLTKESCSEREENERRYNEFKNRIENQYEKRQSENDKKVIFCWFKFFSKISQHLMFNQKLNEMVSKYEKEKFEIQKQHTKSFQDLVDETNVKLKRVEAEYNEQQNINVILRKSYSFFLQ